jgi:hypothetical protein
MRDTVLWRKQSHIIMMIAEALDIDAERALDLFYSTDTYRKFSNPNYGLYLMSDLYIVDEVIRELQGKT